MKYKLVVDHKQGCQTNGTGESIVRDNRILSLSSVQFQRAKSENHMSRRHIHRYKERRYRRVFVVSVTVQALIKV